MQPNTDLTEVLAALNEEGARYLIVFGYPFAFHGRPRATKDIDLFIGSDPENGKRVWHALVVFDAPLSELTERDISTPDVVFADVEYLEKGPAD